MQISYKNLGNTLIVCIGVSVLNKKHHPGLSCQAPLKSANCPSPPFLGKSPCILAGVILGTEGNIQKIQNKSSRAVSGSWTQF